MAWFGWKMAWLEFCLVQLQQFWTSIALNIAKWQLFKKGYCCLYQGQQLSYIVLDTHRSLIILCDLNYLYSPFLLPRKTNPSLLHNLLVHSIKYNDERK
jgi:hypothetical protein